MKPDAGPQAGARRRLCDRVCASDSFFFFHFGSRTEQLFFVARMLQACFLVHICAAGHMEKQCGLEGLGVDVWLERLEK